MTKLLILWPALFLTFFCLYCFLYGRRFGLLTIASMALFVSSWAIGLLYLLAFLGIL